MVQTSKSDEIKTDKGIESFREIERTLEIPQQPSKGRSKKGKIDCPLPDCNKIYVSE